MWVALAALISGCTVLPPLDVCERPLGTETDLNILTEGQQFFSSRLGLAAWPAGGAFAVFVSTPSGLAGDPTVELRTELRAVMVSGNGEKRSTCDSPHHGEYVLASAQLLGTTGILSQPVVAAPRQDGDVALVVFTFASMATAPKKPYGIFVGSSGCPWSPGDFFALDDSNSSGSVERPAEIVRIGENTFVVVWMEYNNGSIEARIRGRVIQGGLGVPPRFLPSVLSPQTGSAGTVAVYEELPVGIAATEIDETRWALVWYDLIGGDLKIRLALFDDRLALLSSPVVLGAVHAQTVRPFLPQDQSLAVAFEGSIGMVAWSQWMKNGDGVRAFGKFFDHAGSALKTRSESTEGGFSLATHPAGKEAGLQLIPIKQGGFLSLWDSSGADAEGGPSRRDVRAAAFNRDGNRTFLNQACGEADFRVNKSDTGDQYRPVGVRTVDGELVIGFTQEGAKDTGDPSGAGLRVLSTSSRAIFAEE